MYQYCFRSDAKGYNYVVTRRAIITAHCKQLRTGCVEYWNYNDIVVTAKWHCEKYPISIKFKNSNSKTTKKWNWLKETSWPTNQKLCLKSQYLSFRSTWCATKAFCLPLMLWQWFGPADMLGPDWYIYWAYHQNSWHCLWRYIFPQHEPIGFAPLKIQW